MKEKVFKIPKEKLKQLIAPIGSCIASDMITVDGLPIGFMYREEKMDSIDSGWRFFSGLEGDEYINDPKNLMMYDVNTIANYDPYIIPYLKLKIGSELERNTDNTFNLIG
jgi:hypothetical protein